MWRVCLLSCLVVATFATNTYVVILPKVVRPGLSLSVGVNILKAEGDVSVTAKLVDTANNGTIGTVSGSVTMGEPKSLTIQVPRTLKSSKYRVDVVGQGGLLFQNSTVMEYNAKGSAIFIQTDKAMYKPGQTVHFRTFAVYPDLKSFTGTFSVDIYDPNTNKIKQWMNLHDESSVITQQFSLSDQPVLGDWKIKVVANGKSEEKTFTVAEYVLPKFEVTVELPPFGLTRDPSLKGAVKAKYTYGKSVHGTAHIRVRNERWYRPSRFEGPEPMIETDIAIKDGKAAFTFTMDQLQHVANPNGNGNYLNNHELLVEANVTDALTGSTMKGSSKIHYYQQGVKLEWLKSNPKNFKPGLPYTAYLKISHQDGSPIIGLKKDLGLHSTVTYNLPDEPGTTPRYFFPRTGNYQLPDINMTVPDNGLVPVQVEIPDNATNINIRALYSDALDVTLSIQKMNSPSDSFIQTFLKSSTLSAGQMAEFELKSTSPMTTIVYQIISRGSIVTTGTLNGRDMNLATFSVPVTSKMAPSARIVVYFVRDDGEIVTDSISFNVDGLFENQVSLHFDKTKAEPGQQVNVVVSADANSVVNLLAVDQSVLLLKSGNDITAQQVMEEIGSFDSVKPPFYGGPVFFGGMARMERREKRMFWWPYPYYYGGNDAGDIFRNAGVVVLTDALVFHHEEPVYYPFMHMVLGDILPRPSMPTNHVSSLKEVDHVRKLFPETWLWTSQTIGICYVQPTFLDLFLSLNLCMMFAVRLP